MLLNSVRPSAPNPKPYASSFGQVWLSDAKACAILGFILSKGSKTSFDMVRLSSPSMLSWLSHVSRSASPLQARVWQVAFTLSFQLSIILGATRQDFWYESSHSEIDIEGPSLVWHTMKINVTVSSTEPLSLQDYFNAAESEKLQAPCDAGLWRWGLGLLKGVWKFSAQSLFLSCRVHADDRLEVCSTSLNLNFTSI